MEQVCYGCFNGILNEQGVCTACGYDSAKDREKYPLALPAGSILYGQFIIGKVLGQGGFGITYLAQNYQTKELVAIKEFFPDSMVTRTATTAVTPFSGERGENFDYGKARFLDEAQTMAEFNGNPNIAGVQMYFEENGTAYFVMEYIDGISFESYIKSHGGSLHWNDTLKIMLPVLKALDAVHGKGIIHRDVTPDNIYITNDGTVKLLDFGAARHSLGNASRSLDVILKHGFAPREQYSRRGRQGPYTDVYAASASIYYAITGMKPDDAIERTAEDNMPLPSNLGAKVTPEQEDVLLKGLALEAQDRYQTMGEFCAALEQVSDAALVAVPVVTAANAKTGNVPEKDTASEAAVQQEEEKEKKKRFVLPVLTKKMKIGLLAAACAVVLLCGVLMFWLGHPHIYGRWVPLQEATCTETGTAQRRCFCGETETRVLEANGHTSIVDEAIAASCTEAGITEGAHCSACGEVFTAQQKVEALGHDIAKIPAVAPTCTATGLTEGTSCQRCGLVEVAQTEVAMVEHTVVTDAAVAATCLAEGKTEGSHCSVCSKVIVEQKATPKGDHAPVTDPGYAATCVAEGKTEGSHCSVCNKVIVEQKSIAKVDHAVVTDYGYAATCTKEGKTDGSHCSVCNKVFTEQKSIAKTAHTPVTDKGYAATCAKEGKTDGSHCSVCNAVIEAQKSIAKIAHTPVTDKGYASTCSAEGKTDGSHCSVCNAVIEAQKSIAKTAHTPVTDKGYAATCAQEGKTDGSHCSVCNTVIEAQESIAKKAHKSVTDYGYEATCTQEGKTDGSHCSVCGTVIEEQKVIDQLGHEWRWNMDNGQSWCTRCDVGMWSAEAYFTEIDDKRVQLVINFHCEDPNRATDAFVAYRYNSFALSRLDLGTVRDGSSITITFGKQASSMTAYVRLDYGYLLDVASIAY